MKDFILALVAVLLLVLLLFSINYGTSYKETKEYPIESIRYYTETESKGLFTTKINIYKKVEFVYIDSNGEHIKETISVDEIMISNESKVVEEEGWYMPDLYLTLEDYEKLLVE